MKYCLKWHDVEITGFQLYKWNEKLMRNNISEDKAIFVFRRHPDHRVKRILQVKLQSLVEPLPSFSTGDFRARIDSGGFNWILFRSGLFWTNSPEDERVVRTLVNLTRSSFDFSGFTVNHPYAPRLVFVIDFSYTPLLHLGCGPRIPGTSGSRRGPLPICSVPHGGMIPDVTDKAEDDMLRKIPAYDSDFEEDEVDSNEAGREGDPNDPESRYSGEVKELVTRLRRYRNVGRTFPLRPRSDDDPVGMEKVGRPVMWSLTVPENGDCGLCKGKMKVGDVVIKVSCGHVFHRDCAMAWITTRGHTMCPVCREPLARRI